MMWHGPIHSNYVDSKEAFLATGMVSLTDLKLVHTAVQEKSNNALLLCCSSRFRHGNASARS